MTRGDGKRPEQLSRDPLFASERFVTVTRCAHVTLQDTRCQCVAELGSLYCVPHRFEALPEQPESP